MGFSTAEGMAEARVSAPGRRNFFGLIAMLAAWFFQVEYQWDGMQRYYLAHYVVSSAGLFQKYLVLHTVDRRGRWHPTVPAEVVPVQMASYPHGVIHLNPHRNQESVRKHLIRQGSRWRTGLLPAGWRQDRDPGQGEQAERISSDQAARRAVQGKEVMSRVAEIRYPSRWEEVILKTTTWMSMYVWTTAGSSVSSLQRRTTFSGAWPMKGSTTFSGRPRYSYGF